MNNILIFGDSIAAGRGVKKEKSWPFLLAQYFDKKDKNSNLVYNLGIPGESTNEIIERFSVETQARFKKETANRSYIIFATGINDSKCIGSKDNPITDTKKLKKNIGLLIDNARKYTENIFFIGPTLVDEKKTVPIGTNYFLNEKILKYSDIIESVCSKNNISFTGIGSSWKQKKYIKFLAEDGIHPNPLGHKFIYEKIVNTIEKN